MGVQQCRRCGQMHDAYTGCTMAVRAATARSTVVGEDEALVGNVVAERYQVGDVLGQGSTGTVFAVTHTSFNRPAAMKVLRPRYAQSDLVTRVFHGEARAAWSVTHPGLCEVFDIGTLPDGAPFFVMERLEGETLATRVSRERLSLAASVDMMMQLLSAIAAIHARDLLLRDLRPQNIYLAHRRGCRPLLKILDFGLARLSAIDLIQRDWDQIYEAGGTSSGTGPHAIPYYLSPERARGEHGVEPASDLFVAAAIFYEALAGERAFNGNSFESLLIQVCAGKPVPLHEIRPEIATDLSNFITRALSPNPRNRPATAKEMQDELRATFEGARRGSTSMAIAPVASPSAPSSDHPPHGASSTAPPAGAASASTSTEESTFASMAVSVPIKLTVPHRTAAASSDLAAATVKKDVASSSAAAALMPDELPRVYDAYSDEYKDETETKREPAALAEAAVAAADALAGMSGGPTSSQTDPGGILVSMNEEDVATQARRVDVRQLVRDAAASAVDEASAENSDRTVPPPPLSAQTQTQSAGEASIEVDVSGLGIPQALPGGEEPRTISRKTPAVAMAKAKSSGAVREPEIEEEDEETETMELNPELRARVDQLMAQKGTIDRKRPTGTGLPAIAPQPLQPPPRTKPPRR
jgi:eukaryotic-like serine/threonine-protein kinase